MFCNKVLIKSRLTKNNKQGKLQSFTLQIQIQCLKKKKETMIKYEKRVDYLLNINCLGKNVFFLNKKSL